MGALIFMALMFVLLCLGGFFLLLGLIFLLLRHRGRKKGTPKKRHAVLAGVWNQSHTDTTRTDTAYPLPADIADYFSDLLPD